MTTIQTEMPRWRTDDLYAGLQDPALARDLETLRDEVQALEGLFDEHGIGAGAPVTAGVLDAALNGVNHVARLGGPLRAYLAAFVSTDSRNEAAQSQMAAFTTLVLPLGPLRSRLTAWVGGLSEAELSALLNQSEVARAHAHTLRDAVREAQYLMSPSEEDLAARLHPASGGGWGKLHGNVSSTLRGEFRGQWLPVTALRALASDPDASVREDAYHAEIAAWKSQEVVFAACMNGVKGESGLLALRRGFADVVAPSLMDNGIDQGTLDAMQAAVVAALPDFRRYFRAKATRLGKVQLDWWDLFAPAGKSETHWSYEAGAEFVERQFRGYSDALGDFAAQAFREDWIDAGPRDGKRSGAFCMRWQGSDSRILMNHDPSLDSVSTLAHELGHGYHNRQLGDLPPLQRETPMTLAETASIFCETIIQNAALETAQGQERLYVLETQLMGHAQVVVDIHSRFLFEKAVFERRLAGDLNPSDLGDLMVWAQRETYGDALNTPHPYMWAVKPHYYGRSFYNYPYTFGLLFGLGLYAQYEQARAGGQEADFQARYDALLAATGQATPLELAARFGIDLHASAFWEGSLNVIRRQIEAYEGV